MKKSLYLLLSITALLTFHSCGKVVVPSTEPDASRRIAYSVRTDASGKELNLTVYSYSENGYQYDTFENEELIRRTIYRNEGPKVYSEFYSYSNGKVSTSIIGEDTYSDSSHKKPLKLVSRSTQTDGSIYVSTVEYTYSGDNPVKIVTTQGSNGWTSTTTEERTYMGKDYEAIATSNDGFSETVDKTEFSVQGNTTISKSYMMKPDYSWMYNGKDVHIYSDATLSHLLSFAMYDAVGKESYRAEYTLNEQNEVVSVTSFNLGQPYYKTVHEFNADTTVHTYYQFESGKWVIWEMETEYYEPAL